jgi:flagellar export protein FliJ
MHVSPETFQFRFQKVLDLREQQQRALEIELARLDAVLAQARQEVARWEGELAESLRALAAARRVGDLDEAASHTGYLKHVRARIQRAQAAVEEGQRHREVVRRRLERVMQSCKMLETYRDRLQREFMAAQERAEERIVELHSMHKFHQAKRAQ